MYAKLKSDGTIQNAPNPLRIVVANPTPEVYEQWGYHEVTDTTPPEYDAAKQKIASHYEMQNGKIVQVWEVTDLPESETADTAPAEDTENEESTPTEDHTDSAADSKETTSAGSDEDTSASTKPEDSSAE